MKAIANFVKANPACAAFITIVAVVGIDNIVVNICKAISYKATLKELEKIDNAEITEIKF